MVLTITVAITIIITITIFITNIPPTEQVRVCEVALVRSTLRRAHVVWVQNRRLDYGNRSDTNMSGSSSLRRRANIFSGHQADN